MAFLDTCEYTGLRNSSTLYTVWKHKVHCVEGLCRASIPVRSTVEETLSVSQVCSSHSKTANFQTALLKIPYILNKTRALVTKILKITQTNTYNDSVATSLGDNPYSVFGSSKSSNS